MQMGVVSVMIVIIRKRSRGWSRMKALYMPSDTKVESRKGKRACRGVSSLFRSEELVRVDLPIPDSFERVKEGIVRLVACNLHVGSRPRGLQDE